MSEDPQELVDIEHPDIDGIQTVTSGQARVLAKSGWSRAATAKARKKPAQDTPTTAAPAASESPEED